MTDIQYSYNNQYLYSILHTKAARNINVDFNTNINGYNRTFDENHKAIKEALMNQGHYPWDFKKVNIKNDKEAIDQNPTIDGYKTFGLGDNNFFIKNDKEAIDQNPTIDGYNRTFGENHKSIKEVLTNQGHYPWNFKKVNIKNDKEAIDQNPTIDGYNRTFGESHKSIKEVLTNQGHYPWDFKKVNIKNDKEDIDQNPFADTLSTELQKLITSNKNLEPPQISNEPLEQNYDSLHIPQELQDLIQEYNSTQDNTTNDFTCNQNYRVNDLCGGTAFNNYDSNFIINQFNSENYIGDEDNISYQYFPTK